MGIKHSILNWLWQRRTIIDYGITAAGFLFHGGWIPFLRRVHPLMNPRNNYIVNLPINRELTTDSMELPPAVLTELIRQSRYHVVLEDCICRHGRDCKKHSRDIGCLFLGESSLDVPRQFCRRITSEEALAHMDRAVKEGLVPMTLRARIDNLAFLLPDRHRLLGVCFCCDCCCILNNYRHVPVEHLDSIFPRLEGLEIIINDDCTGCGTCVKTCYMKAISIEDGRARHAGTCRSCGRCASSCPNGAVTITMNDPDFVDKTVNKFLSLVKLD
jgi:ferredoxin